MCFLINRLEVAAPGSDKMHLAHIRLRKDIPLLAQQTFAISGPFEQTEVDVL